jgi:hypothetical protein
LTYEWIKKNVAYTYNGTSFNHKKEIFTHTTKWMNQRNKPIKKTNIVLFLLYEVTSQIHRDRNRNGGCQQLGRGRMGNAY